MVLHQLLSNKIVPKAGAIDFSQLYLMELYTNTNDPMTPLYRRGHRFDIHKMIGKLLIKPKKGLHFLVINIRLMSDHHAI